MSLSWHAQSCSHAALGGILTPYFLNFPRTTRETRENTAKLAAKLVEEVSDTRCGPSNYELTRAAKQTRPSLPSEEYESERWRW